MTLDPRSSVETIFQAALQAVAGDQAVMDAVVEDEFGSRVHLVAIGKAASAMALGAKRVLDGQITQALILTKYEHTAPELLADCLLYTSPSPRDATLSRMPSSA